MNILVTGGASGLGQAITRRLAEWKTNKVYFTYKNSARQAEQLQRDVVNTTAIECDFRRADHIHSLLDEMHGMNLDVLINNAMPGMTEMHFHKMDSRIFYESFQSCVIPTVQITQRAIRIFREKKSGKIITILTSALINRPPIGWSEYVANKAYLHSLSKSWAVENARFNITSNCVSPSLMQTNLTKEIDERIIEEMVRSHPLKRLLTPQEVAGAISLLIESTQHINGMNLVINSASDVI